MTVDLGAAETFLFANARLLDRLRYAQLFRGAPAEPVLAALAAYRNPDGGFGHALEPDVRTPDSECTTALHALEVLVEAGAGDSPLVAGVADWVAGVADPDGGVPFVLPAATAYPRGPWMQPAPGASHLTFGIAGALWRAGLAHPWRDRATAWCWARLADPQQLSAYWVKFALTFLDAVPDASRAQAALASLRPLLAADGSLPVPGGTDNERLDPLTLSPHPNARSRALFTDRQIAAALDDLEAGQGADGGWTFDWLAWSPGQTVEWRGALTLRALVTLREHGRLAG